MIQILARELQIGPKQAKAAVDLIDEGNTIPFIARYRKELTGSLNDEVLRNLEERLRYLRNLSERQEQVLSSIAEQGMLDDELREKISQAMTLVEVEDLYRPYKPKKRTRAMIAREKGLEPFARLIFDEEADKELSLLAAGYVKEDGELSVPDEGAALSGALDIIAEWISDSADFRSRIRKDTFEQGRIVSAAKDPEEKSVYENYYDFEEPLEKIVGHRILAINRGEKEKILKVKILAEEEMVLAYLQRQIIKKGNPHTKEALTVAIEDSYKRLIAPAIEREIRNELTERAQEGAIRIFGKNLEQLLLQPPVKGRVVLGWDPAFRTGCKLAVVDETGKVLETAVIFPTAPQNKTRESKEVLKRMIKEHGVQLISVGNGTASRESERFITDLIKELDKRVEYVIVNEAGASVYSASKLATEEFPSFDVGQRSAVSIARRLQDPLAELVKIDPKSIGVGQYQHDMDQKNLSLALEAVVEDSVNKVGVDLNTASASLLEYISGINKTIAKNIIAYREENGAFTSRKELLKVSKLGPKAFLQCAGFMRIQDAMEPLDATSVHPESYDTAKRLLEILGYSLEQGHFGGIEGIMKKARGRGDLAAELGVGEPTLLDILRELEKPARDPRDDMPAPILRSDVLEMEDLKEGMILKGTVRNVIDFGAFVDIGVHQDGLVHISRMSKRYIKHPLEVLKVGDVVEVRVMGVDLAKKRISLSMILDLEETVRK